MSEKGNTHRTHDDYYAITICMFHHLPPNSPTGRMDQDIRGTSTSRGVSWYFVYVG